jgi:hypothetical protein
MTFIANRGREALGMDGSSDGAQAINLGELQVMDKERLERFTSEGA